MIKKIIKKTVNIIRSIILVILILILAVNICLIINQLINKEELPKVLGISESIVLSGSMEPVFSPGDLVIFKEQENYQVNDIVIFHTGSTLITHRIVGEQDGTFVTKGDANNTEDSESVSADSVEGKLIFIIPKIGSVMLFLKTPLGLFIVIAAGLFLFEMGNFLEDHSKNKDKDEK